jgi:hypothetical protein
LRADHLFGAAAAGCDLLLPDAHCYRAVNCCWSIQFYMQDGMEIKRRLKEQRKEGRNKRRYKCNKYNILNRIY